MPLYNYACEDCGPFTAWQPMSRAGEPADCPACARPGARMLSAPFCANMDPNNRVAHQRNEKSAHEPQVMSRQRLDKLGAKRSAGHHHGHAHSHASSRPWMVGH